MIERSIVAIEDMKQSVAELLPGTMSNLTRETAIEVLAQLQSVMLERERLLKEIDRVGLATMSEAIAVRPFARPPT